MLYPIERAEQLFVQLRRIGSTIVEMVRFSSESNNLSGSGRPHSRVERLEPQRRLFDRHRVSIIAYSDREDAG